MPPAKPLRWIMIVVPALGLVWWSLQFGWIRLRRKLAPQAANPQPRERAPPSYLRARILDKLIKKEASAYAAARPFPPAAR
jgi:hypothetical protein